MALTTYKEKRDLKVSTEPSGGSPDTTKLRFVIQKHHASRLHYDFRLEMEGVLKSWAVPKGPSTDPSIKRLALMVEDHPYDYRSFEGNIPSGYGAGTVIVWDEGFYELADANGMEKAAQDKLLRKGIHAGKLHVALHGKKLKGEYALVKTHGKDANAWLLFKVKDKYVSKADITLEDKSVISRKTLEQVKKTSSALHKAEPAARYPENVGKESSLKRRDEANGALGDSRNRKKDIIVKKKPHSTGKSTRLPSKISPMLAIKASEPFDKEGWQYEIKWDGYRAVAFCNKNSVELKSRNDKSLNHKFHPVHIAIQNWNINAVVDGEVVVLGKDGTADFGSLQHWRSEADGDIFYYVFDLLWFNGKDLTQLPLSERRSMLMQMVPEHSIIRFSENFDVGGIELFEAAKKMGLEGIMAKRSDSVYSAGNRSKNWIKIKANNRQEMIIGGYTKNDSSSKSFSALLLGVFEKGSLIYTGKAGTGFSDKQQIELLKLFKPLVVTMPPFSTLPDINKPSRFQRNLSRATPVWLKPELVCEVNFTEMTAEGVMRHPSFVALRIDKPAKEVTQDKNTETIGSISKTNHSSEVTRKPVKMKNRELFLDPAADTDIRKLNGHEIKFTNLNKLYWAKEKISKRDMLNYYFQIAPYILPYLKDRPQSMNRHPNGIDGKSFYFKDVTGTAPEWIETFEYKSNADNRLRNYLVAKDEASLLYMATLGCIEMNPWHSKITKEDYPDWCIIDLDPAENTFTNVIEAANVTREILESMEVTSYPKTSGSTGMHIYIPMGAKYTYEQSKEFARIIATLVQREIPEYTSIERVVKSRKGKMYIDFLQNRPQATVAAPYSLRPKPGATVSMPLLWDEVKKGLKISDFTIFNALERITSEGDVFKPVLGKGINLKKAIDLFDKG